MATPSTQVKPTEVSFMKRSQFPKDFLFGTASSAFQVEGAADEDGRKPSIWDTFADDHNLETDHGHSWAHGVGHYHRYKEDVEIMKNMGLDAYRFSISWSRILPEGTKAGGENPEGIKFYKNLINELLANDIEPMVTLFHWDLPQALEDKYGGFLDSRIIEDFRDYADVCFREFGDSVKYWITLNEPWTFCNFGYAMGYHAPGRGYDPRRTEAVARFRRSAIEEAEKLLPPSPFTPRLRTRVIKKKELFPCTPYSCPPPPSRREQQARSERSVVEHKGDPGTEPYIVAHHQLLAHGATVKLYREKYQSKNKGQIGMALVTIWPEPYSDTDEDKSAADRVLDFYFGWFMEPTFSGDYPASMRKYLKDRLPVFTPEQSELVKGSYDFVGLNYYTANFVEHAPQVGNIADHYAFHPLADFPRTRDGKHIGDLGDSDWLYVYPEGIYKLLTYINKKYKSPCIHITENGFAEDDDPNKSLWVSLFDHKRVAYYHDHLLMVQKAIAEGTKVKSYFTWSIFDNFEWTYAFNSRFGNNFVDYKNNLARYPKLSSGWLKFLHD